MVKFKRQVIALAKNPNIPAERIVKDMNPNAFVSGNLAFHKDGDYGGYIITHIPTGLKIAQVDSDKEARELISRLAHLDWNFTGENQAPKVTREECKRICREFKEGVY